jgi:pyruvate/2-oxoglutarate dehydrogenase complex dihydrolipoamide acyltransferase (E2) component
VAAPSGSSITPLPEPVGVTLDEMLVVIEDVPESDDDNVDVDAASPRPRQTVAPAASGPNDLFIHPSAPAPSSSSTLSPNAAPFLPRGSKTGWPKARRWADEDLIDIFDAEMTPTSFVPYRDALLRETRVPQPT